MSNAILQRKRALAILPGDDSRQADPAAAGDLAFRSGAAFQNMNRLFIAVATGSLATCGGLAQTANTAFLDHQHVELKIQYAASGASHLSISALDTETQILYPSDQVVLVVKPSAMTTLPDRVIIRDALPTTSGQRYYRLQVDLH